ncbi:hypothetical protein M3G32_10595, partial [Corynebacterium sanguinis]|uniref:hypothetical protein n=1 Tax=Corynebacterium sanguinis TaxID=2594913 RepID=UPI00223B6E73
PEEPSEEPEEPSEEPEEPSEEPSDEPEEPSEEPEEPSEELAPSGEESSGINFEEPRRLSLDSPTEPRYVELRSAEPAGEEASTTELRELRPPVEPWTGKRGVLPGLELRAINGRALVA